MIILVCGGRDYNDYEFVCKTLDTLAPSMIIHGGAPGADSLAERYALEHGIPTKVYPADWEKYKDFAGKIRNQKMLDLHQDINVAVAFPGGPGTRDMIFRATAQHFNVIQMGGK